MARAVGITVSNEIIPIRSELAIMGLTLKRLTVAIKYREWFEKNRESLTLALIDGGKLEFTDEV